MFSTLLAMLFANRGRYTITFFGKKYYPEGLWRPIATIGFMLFGTCIFAAVFAAVNIIYGYILMDVYDFVRTDLSTMLSIKLNNMTPIVAHIIATPFTVLTHLLGKDDDREFWINADVTLFTALYVASVYLITFKVLFPILGII